MARSALQHRNAQVVCLRWCFVMLFTILLDFTTGYRNGFVVPKSLMLFGSKNVRSIQSTERMNLLLTGISIGSLCLTTPILANTFIIPTKEDIRLILNDKELDTSVLDAENFRRLDERNDEEFYSQPKLVEHVDEHAVRLLKEYHGEAIKRINRRKSANEDDPVNVFDVCCSHSSHLPVMYNSPGGRSTYKVSGLGMNKFELENNQAINAERIVQNLNVKSSIPLPDLSYDLILLQLSIDYLIHPIEVLKELKRIVTKEGEIIISFSNRIFLTKAIANWTGKSDVDHIDLVSQYIKLAGLTLVDVVADNTKGSDPLYLLIARK